MDLVSGFAKAIGCPVLGVVPRDSLEDNEMFVVPDPLSREALRDLVLRYGD